MKLMSFFAATLVTAGLMLGIPELDNATADTGSKETINVPDPTEQDARSSVSF